MLSIRILCCMFFALPNLFGAVEIYRHMFRADSSGEVVNLHTVEDYYRRNGPKFRNWEVLGGEVISVAKDGVILETASQRYIFLTGFPEQDRLVDGVRIAFMAEHVGRYSYRTALGGLSTVEKWSYGKPTPPDEAARLERVYQELTAEAAELAREKAAKNLASRRAKLSSDRDAIALKNLQLSAEAGNASSQYALGMRYATGRGVETNRDLAISWLERSAAQGNSTASNALVEIRRPGGN